MSSHLYLHKKWIVRYHSKLHPEDFLLLLPVQAIMQLLSIFCLYPHLDQLIDKLTFGFQKLPLPRGSGLPHPPIIVTSVNWVLVKHGWVRWRSRLSAHVAYSCPVVPLGFDPIMMLWFNVNSDHVSNSSQMCGYSSLQIDIHSSKCPWVPFGKCSENL